MSFSDAEKAQLLFALGRSVFEDDGPAMRAINSLDSKEALARPVLSPILDELTSIDAQISDAKIRLMAVEDGSTKIDAAREIQMLRSLGRQAVGRISRWLKVSVPRNCDIYSASLPDDDFYAGDPSEARFDNSLGAPTLRGG